MKYLKSKLQKTMLLLSMILAMLLAPVLASAQTTLATTSIGGFNIITDATTGFLVTLELGSIQGALGTIFVVVFSLIAIFLGFRKLSMLFRRG